MRVHARLSFIVTSNSPSPVTLIRCFIGRSKPLGRLEEFGRAVFHKEVKIQRSPGSPSNKIIAQKGISIGEAARRVADLGWTPTYVQEAMTFPTDYKISKAPKDPMKQVLRSYFPMQEEKDNRVYMDCVIEFYANRCWPPFW